MAKNPWLKFYMGDYIKDTRILPLNVRGGWMDLIIFMWENGDKGELIGTIDDFARVMCCSTEEANLVIQTLKQRKIFSYEELSGGLLKIISRKQKEMVKLSKTRQDVGKEGGNPVLLNQSLKQKDNLNSEYEYKPESDSEFKKGGMGEGLAIQMVSLYTQAFPDYPVNHEKDYPSSVKLAYHIAASKKITKEAATNGRMSEVLLAWKSIVDFVKLDDWFRTRSISDLEKQYQTLFQTMKNKKNGNKRTHSEQHHSEPKPEGGFGFDV